MAGLLEKEMSMLLLFVAPVLSTHPFLKSIIGFTNRMGLSNITQEGVRMEHLGPHRVVVVLK